VSIREAKGTSQPKKKRRAKFGNRRHMALNVAATLGFSAKVPVDAWWAQVEKNSGLPSYFFLALADTARHQTRIKAFQECTPVPAF
jgi:hypothetical protein